MPLNDYLPTFSTVAPVNGVRAATPKNEDAEYAVWKATNNVPESNDYDMRGYYTALKAGDPRAVSGVNPNDNQLHFPDTWKLPNHASFSTESMYYNPVTMPQTPSWQGGKIGATGLESWSLTKPDGTQVISEAPWRLK